MNITELRYLVAIRKWGSVSAAAKQLYAAQPNVSKAHKNLEEEYGIRIFERSSTGMIPTEQGRHFIQQAERVLDEVDRLFCHGLFGDADEFAVEARPVFERHYPGMSQTFEGGHRMNADLVHAVLFPFIDSLGVL